MTTTGKNGPRKRLLVATVAVTVSYVTLFSTTLANHAIYLLFALTIGLVAGGVGFFIWVHTVLSDWEKKGVL